MSPGSKRPARWLFARSPSSTKRLGAASRRTYDPACDSMNRFFQTLAALTVAVVATATEPRAQTRTAPLSLGIPVPDPVGDAAQALPDWASAPVRRAVDDPPGFPGTPGGPSGPPGFPSTPAQVPVDGGLSVLALAGVAYGARRLSKRRGTRADLPGADLPGK